LSYLSQLVAILLPQFLSAATGIAALAAVARALAGSGVGNFLRDLTRITVLFLLPLSLLLGGALILCNMPMTLQGAAQATTLEGVAQTIARGPVAAIVAIKQLGTNGGGYFGPNSAHPFENPSFLSNLLENGAILLIPMALVWYFGAVIGRMRHATTLFAVMSVVFIVLVTFASSSESQAAPALQGLPVAEAANLEGKEMRFGTDAGALWAVSTTATSNGSVNAMHDSLNPLTGLAPLTGMWLNITFGGVGVGLINMLVFVVVAVFCAGLMVGRTPEYLGRKVESREMTLATFTILLHPLLILGGTALFIATGWTAATIQDPGHHGLSEVVYEFSSAAANNGSGFEGLGDNTPAWNIATALAMLLGRFLPIVLPLAIAASLGAKPRLREHAGTFRSDSPTFALILLAVILIVGALLFLPVAMVGPVAEHLAGPAMAAGVTP
jgi:K+-transporting ATPase ATPase A chain